MITHLKEYVNKLKKYSHQLDDIALLVDQPWISSIEGSDSRCVYIFKKDNQLLISINGKVETGTWEYISAMKALLIKNKDEITLFNKSFFDGSVLILKKDGTEDYQLFANENKIVTTIENLLKDIEKKHRNTLNEPHDTIESNKIFYINSNNITLEVYANNPKGYTLGDEVCINGVIAPDGKYTYGDGGVYFIEVKDGKIIVV